MANLDDTYENNNTLFGGLEMGYSQEEELPEDYERIRINDLENGEAFKGRPIMSEVHSFTVDEDGEEVEKYRFKFFVVNDDDEEILDMNINLKKDGDIQTNINKKAVLYDFIASIKNIESPGFTSQYNRINKVNLAEFREFLNECGEVKVVCKNNSGGNFTYNSIVFKKIKP